MNGKKDRRKQKGSESRKKRCIRKEECKIRRREVKRKEKENREGKETRIERKVKKRLLDWF